MSHPQHDKRVYDSILDVIGHTPLVRLNRITHGLACTVYAKLEFLNPMGSSKDRIAKYLVEAAERDGRLKPGDLILENSSGNTAMGLALVAIQKGYRLKAVVRDRTSKEKLDQLTALGVDVHRVDTSLPPDHPDSYNNITPRLARELPRCYFPDQHNNRENNDAHYHGTGPELWEQMDGRIDVFIAGMGTGGTIGGVGRYLKERNPGVKVVAVDVEGSVFTDYFRTGVVGKPHPYLLEGLGDEFLIGTADFTVIDEMVQVSDREAFLGARTLAREEGLLVGGSSGAVLHALFQVADRYPEGTRVAVLFSDSASRYLSTIFNDEWMREKGML
jgi:cystathionine beta-synthase